MKLRLQVSLRVMLRLTAIIAILMAWAGDRIRIAHEQKDAARQLQALGCIVQYDWQPQMAQWRNVANLRLEPDAHAPLAASWGSWLLGDDFFQTVQAVAVRGARLEWDHAVTGGEMLKGFSETTTAYKNLDSLVEQLRRLDGLEIVYVDSWPLRGSSDQLSKRLAKELPDCKVLRSNISTVAAPRVGKGDAARSLR